MKNIVLLFVSLFFVSTTFSQDEGADFIPGGGEFKMAFFGELCENLEKESSRNKCSQDQIKEYIGLLKTPEIVEKKKLHVSTIINFDLSQSGEVENVTIKKSSGKEEIDALCLEHIKKMPNWSPEINDDQVIASENLNLTFKFKYTPKEKK